MLKEAFAEAPTRRHYDWDLETVVESDASDYAIAAILSQKDAHTGTLQPIAFFTRSMGPAELNYDIYDKELLAIVEAFHHWRAYLKGSRHTIQVFSDHNNLQFFTTTSQLSQRQAHWSEFLSGFDFNITY